MDEEINGGVQPDTDITQVRDWVTLVTPSIVNIGHTVTHCNLAVVSALLLILPHCFADNHGQHASLVQTLLNM